MNKIVIGTYTFEDNEILSGSVCLTNSPIGESLSVDTFDFTVVSGYDYFCTALNEYFCFHDNERLVVVGGAMIGHVNYGQPIEYYHDDELVGKFYLTAITQVERNQYKVESVSAVGLLSYIDHYGGIYGLSSTQYVTDLIEDIIGNIDVTIDSVFDTMMIQGYLPKATARDNLRQVLFAVGASILKDANGDWVITYNQPETATVIQPQNIYLGGKVLSQSHATKVTLTEHSYFVGTNTTAQDIFNNLTSESTAVNQEITFTQPYYDLHAYDANGNEITSTFIRQSGVNYAIIGTANVSKGRITGKPYEHSQRQIVKNTGVVALEAKEIAVTDATLVSPLNSTNCIERLASFYGGANEVNIDIVYDDEKTGELVSFAHPYEDGNKLGYIKEMDISLSNTLKSQTKIATDWTPNHLGNTYNAYRIIDSNALGGLSGTWQSGDLAGKEAYIVLFNGAGGGQGGYDGTAGTNASGVQLVSYIYSQGDPYTFYDVYQPMNAGVGGAGGNGGSAGQPCKKYNGVIISSLASSYQVSLGQGGAGGARNGGAGGAGGVTTFGSYRSDVHDLAGTYINIIDGSVYCQNGTNGTKGGNGGNGGTASKSSATPVYANAGANGGNAGSKVGGSGTAGHTTHCTNADNTISWNANVGGGGGGGATATANGGVAGQSDTGVVWSWMRASDCVQYKKGGDGGNGANATQPAITTLGRGATGGHGGGGGGGAGASMSYSLHPTITDEWRPWASGGSAGQGSAGGQGSHGFCVIYYHQD